MTRHDDQGGDAERQGARFKCPKGACDQKIPCAFYCWWNPTMKALNYERDQWTTSR